VGCGGGNLEGRDRPLHLSRAAQGSSEVDDAKRQAEVEKGILSAKLFERDLSLLEAAPILVS
jgi:hypothetical protein